MTRPVIGPNGLALLQHVLALLERHPAGLAAKMEAFAMLNGMTAAFVLQEQADSALQARNMAYLQHTLTSGDNPRLAQLMSQAAGAGDPSSTPQADADIANRYPDLIGRVLTGLLGPS
jgi:hypothetical protein